MIVLIMAGGSGTRFWPLSRESRPKQFLPIISEKTMLQTTVDRVIDHVVLENIYIVTGESQRELVKTDLPELPEKNIIIEPMGRNTAPCIALSVEYLLKREARSREELVLVLAADHRIEDNVEFWESIDKGAFAANSNMLVVFGVVPSYPATGYGYIEKGDSYEKGMFHVKQFREKPSQEIAQSFVQSGNFLWNSGMFLWKLGVIENYLRKFQVIDEKWEHLFEATDNISALKELYPNLKPQPIDIAVMEKAEHRVVVSVDFGWSDVGSWRTLYDLTEKDTEGIAGSGEYASIDSHNTYLRSNKMVALLGVDDLIIVDTPDVLLVARKSDSENVKKILEKLRSEHRNEYL